MAGHGDKLPRKQEQAVAALLANGSIIDAAGACSVAETTLRRWIKEPGFQLAYREARRQVVQQAITQIQSATGAAVRALVAILEDPEAPASSKVAAARTILETAIRGIEVEDLDVRVKTLEAAMLASHERSLNGAHQAR